MNLPFYRTSLPSDNLATRQRIFAGDVFLKPAESASAALVARVISLMQDRLDMEDIRAAHLKWSAEEMFQRIGSRAPFGLVRAEHPPAPVALQGAGTGQFEKSG